MINIMLNQTFAINGNIIEGVNQIHKYEKIPTITFMYRCYRIIFL